MECLVSRVILRKRKKRVTNMHQDSILTLVSNWDNLQPRQLLDN
jgi:hypothetical protein